MGAIMHVRNTYPPNYDAIVAAIPAVKGKVGIVFTYGDTVYAPGIRHALSADLLDHEATHYRQQQKVGIDNWWAEYLADKQFRFDQELEAYRVQWRTIATYNRADRKFLLNHIAKDLASSWYGNIVSSKAEAKDLITA